MDFSLQNLHVYPPCQYHLFIGCSGRDLFTRLSTSLVLYMRFQEGDEYTSCQPNATSEGRSRGTKNNFWICSIMFDRLFMNLVYAWSYQQEKLSRHHGSYTVSQKLPVITITIYLSLRTLLPRSFTFPHWGLELRPLLHPRGWRICGIIHIILVCKCLDGHLELPTCFQVTDSFG